MEKMISMRVCPKCPKPRRYPQMTQISADENRSCYAQRVSKSSECYSDGGLPRMREGDWCPQWG